MFLTPIAGLECHRSAHARKASRENVTWPYRFPSPLPHVLQHLAHRRLERLQLSGHAFPFMGIDLNGGVHGRPGPRRRLKVVMY